MQLLTPLLSLAATSAIAEHIKTTLRVFRAQGTASLQTLTPSTPHTVMPNMRFKNIKSTMSPSPYLMVLEAVTEVKAQQPSPDPSLTPSLASRLSRTRHVDAHPGTHLLVLPPMLCRQIGTGQINNNNYAHQMLRRRVSESLDMLEDENIS